jgi:hypothetical protein
MSPFWRRLPHGLSLALSFLAVAFSAQVLSPEAVQAASRKDKSSIPAVRWDEQRPGCTFSRSDDGRYVYGLSYEDVGITMAVDSQELERVHRRHEPFFAVLLMVHYKGQEPLGFGVNHISMEFVNHFQVVQTALDPDGFAQKVQNDADELNRQTAREVEKHPEKKEAKEAYVRAFLKDSTELQEFVGKNSLRPTRLGPGNPATGGWVLFGTSSKWIGGWKKQEELILRVPLGQRIFEFPFKLPPKPGEVMLRRRP